MNRFYFNTTRVRYMLANWKIGVHLVFCTKRFGTNNQWWCEYDSMFGKSILSRLIMLLKVRPLIEQWKHVRFRAGACHALDDKSYKLLYGETKEEYYKRV